MKLPSLKMIKLTPEFVFVLIAFVAVIFFANYGCCGGVQPFEADNLFPKYSKFEAFGGHEEDKDGEKKEEEEEEKIEEPLANEKEDKNIINNKLQQIKDLAAQLMPSSKDDKASEGFTNMSPSDLGNAYGVIDRVGKLPASAECIGKSHGYSKSTGGVCWDKETENLLLSRGGQGICRGRV